MIPSVATLALALLANLTAQNAPIARAQPTRLDRQLQGLERQLAKHKTPRARVDFLLSRNGSGNSLRSLAAEILLARQAGAAVTLRRAAAKSVSPRVRARALAACWRIEGEANRRGAILDAAIADRSSSVLTHLLSRMGTRSARRAEIGLLAKARAKVAAVIGPKKRRGGGNSTRGHFAILRQRSYLRDFTVEVASRSFIADPEVDVVTSGAVLDTEVLFSKRRLVTVLDSLDRTLLDLRHRVALARHRVALARHRVALERRREAVRRRRAAKPPKRVAYR